MNEWNKRNALRMLLYAVLYAVVTASAACSLCFLISLRSAISSPILFPVKSGGVHLSYINSYYLCLLTK